MTGGSTMSKFLKVARVSELSAGEGKVVDAEGQSIALFNVDGGPIGFASQWRSCDIHLTGDPDP
jgi:hypothetical protein